MDSPSVASPFKTVLDSVGPKHEKALKQAFYNTAAIVFVLLIAVVGVGAYYVLEVFLRPLIWAALCGTFLYPFKNAATKMMKTWLKDLKEGNTPFIVGVSILPIKGLSKSSDLLGTVIKANYKLLISIFMLVPVGYYMIVFHPFSQMFSGIQTISNMLVKIVELFNYPLAVWTIFIGYLVIVLFYKKSSRKVPSSNSDTMLKYLSVTVWFMMLFHLVSLAGIWKVPLALLLFVLIILGFVGDKKITQANKASMCSDPVVKKDNAVKTVVDRTLILFGITVLHPSKSKNDLCTTNSVDLQEETLDSSVSSMESVPEEPASLKEVPQVAKINPSVEALKSTPVFTKKIIIPKQKPLAKIHKHKKRKRIGKSDPYFLALFWLLVISRVWLHSWIWTQLIPILFVIYVLKLVYFHLELGQILYIKFKVIRDLLYPIYLEKEHIIFPGPVKGVIFMMHAGDKKIIAWIDSAMDKLMSAFIILCLGILALVATAIFAVQVHHESSYLITVTADAMNRTITSNQDYLRWLNVNDSNIRKTIDSTVHNAYVLGRHKMVSFISSSVTNNKDVNTSHVEMQITQFLDQLYESWIGKNDDFRKRNKTREFIVNKTSNATTSLLQFQWSKMKQLVNMNDLNNLVTVLKENVHTLLSVLDSIWTILKGNMNLMFSIITHIISMIFFSGTYLLNALISSIIFTTTLFYLLSASSDSYKLVDWFSGISMGTRLSESVSSAIQDVFGASLKMAIFYGLYTWLTHSVFGVNLIFIPAALAAVLGVVPFIGTYWAAVPASMELWLIHDEGLFAVLLLLLHMLPTYVVDTAIYSEIGGGGHPYLTGLAVAGGVYCIGLEGAFVGPIVLCCLIAAFDVYNGIMNDDSTDADDIMKLMGKSNRYRRAMSEDRL